MKGHGATPHDIRKHCLVKPGRRVSLDDYDPGSTLGLRDKEHGHERLDAEAQGIADLQRALYAERTCALLLVLQGTDTSGKDGTTRAVFGHTGPGGVAVTSFKAPSEEELAHDFLWRVHMACPPKGLIGVFNRSHYEDVLVGKVRGLATPEVIEARYGQINAFEELLASSTRIVKVFLHVSRDEQKKRLQSRLDHPEKRWKFDPGDIKDRRLFGEYMRAYETVLSRCSTKRAPWYVVPSDHKWARNAIVAAIVRATLEDMAPRYPVPDWDPAAIVIDGDGD